ncbi:hypothetical protein [Egicoccus halophilus]|uniref:Uncharacterized protein n=1 Tax=Egicoccus halophilus TaxID=1670830 RepID=A0A8J3EUS8_9ACTN|nr:hypothetical protein [Egicoccus halophilus]GGI06574.1 hypothetical protein GCM10011354_19770 [Egicoccus halophilus]
MTAGALLAAPSLPPVPWTPWVAHAGPGSTWQALLTAISLGLVVVAVLAVLGRLRVRSPDDLVLPLAAVAVLSSLAPLADYWLSDWIGWAFPIGVTVLVGLVTAALTPLELDARSPLTWAVVAVAAVGAVVLYRPLTVAWHPPPDYLPLASDAEVEILVPQDGAVIEAGTLQVAVSVAGGSIGPGNAALEDLPPDAEEAGGLTVTLNGERVVVDYLEDCTVVAPCGSVTFPIELEAGSHTLHVEFTRGDGVPLAPMVTDRAEFEVR